MSGPEVVGTIGAVVGIIDGLTKIWAKARQSSNFPDTFVRVSDQLPLLLRTLQICQQRLELIEDSIPDREAQTLDHTVQSCRTRAEKLQIIFRKTIPREDDQWYERYQAVVRRLGQGSRIEELVASIMQDTQILVNYHIVRLVQPGLKKVLENVVAEIQALPSSLPPTPPREPEIGYRFYAGRDSNVNSGSGRMNIMSGVGLAEYSGSGNPTLYFDGRSASSRQAR